MTDYSNLLNRIQVRYSMEEIARAISTSADTLERVKRRLCIPRGDLALRILALHDEVTGDSAASRAMEAAAQIVRAGLSVAMTRSEKAVRARASQPRASGKFVRAA